MRVLVVGSHGQVGRHLVRLLAEAGHEGRAMIRDESQAPEMENLGATPVVADLEGDPAPAAEGSDAIIFTAGGGPGSGAAKKETVDRGGAVKLIEAAKKYGVPRYVMVSAMGADDPDSGSEGMRPYLREPKEAPTPRYARAASITPSSAPAASPTNPRPGAWTPPPPWAVAARSPAKTPPAFSSPPSPPPTPTARPSKSSPATPP